MTDPQGESARWAPVLRDVARVSGHELRNALNALVVNLEVVRSRSDTLDDKVRPFVAQAVEQSEESVRLAEGIISLLNLLVGAVDDQGRVRAVSVEPGTVKIDATESEAVRAARALTALAARTSVTADATETAVILSISEKSPD